jgi:hypothetical protein
MSRHFSPVSAGLVLSIVALGGAWAAPSRADPPTKDGPKSSQSAPSTSASAQPTDTSMSPEVALARATAFYEAGQYAECARAFGELLAASEESKMLAPRAREQASVYAAACLIAQGKTAAADDVFRDAIRENPQMAVPNAIMFPPAVIERFIVVRTTLLEEIRRAEEERAFREREAAYQARRRAEAERERVARLEVLAAQETLVAKNSRWIASVPFGVGQFQNRDDALGAVFLVGETLLLGTAVAATSIELSLHSQAKGGQGFTGQAQVDQLNQNIRTANRVSLLATGGLLLAVAGGILQSNLAFVPEFTEGVRQRARVKPQSASVSLSPVFAPECGGGTFGVFGRF